MGRARHATQERRRRLFAEALAVIERRYDDEWLSVTRLSQDVFCSRRQIQRCFAEAGTSVRERLHAVRMERAAELLSETRLPVAEITRRVGYREPAQFAKAFRRYHGLPPSRWRAGISSSPTTHQGISGACRCGCATSTRASSPTRSTCASALRQDTSSAGGTSSGRWSSPTPHRKQVASGGRIPFAAHALRQPSR